jgi:hypothetical protein
VVRGPVAVAREWPEDVSRHVKGVKDTCITGSHVTPLVHLDLVEAIALALLDADLTGALSRSRLPSWWAIPIMTRI